ncbi:MAG: hypothetical protein K2W80_11630 [Burkholderiales bacterium]|jgi:uncharacterized membrane protein|nr:hypothetical protein [Burkholderiales bacterium]
MTAFPADVPHAETVSAAEPKPRMLLGLVGLLAWLASFAVIDFAHDALMVGGAAGTASGFAYALYELAAGYLLGFVAALAIWRLASLLQGGDNELFAEIPWVRWASVAGLAVVIVACLAGAAMHNANGPTLLYDAAFAAALVVVFAGVVPLYRSLQAARRR